VKTTVAKLCNLRPYTCEEKPKIGKWSHLISVSHQRNPINLKHKAHQQLIGFQGKNKGNEEEEPISNTIKGNSFIVINICGGTQLLQHEKAVKPRVFFRPL